MKYAKLGLLSGILLTFTFQSMAADWYVSLATGKNRNQGTREAPFKNIWKAIEKAAPGDTLHIAAGNYPGKMSCGWINMDKPVNLIGGYNADFSARDPLVYHTMLRPSNAQNTTKPIFGTLTIKTRKFGRNYAVLNGHFSGKVRIVNNVFIGNRMMGADVRSTNGKPGMVDFEFANNTLLFTWTRTKAFEDMGFGVRANANMSTNIHHNIIGLNTMSGFDNTKGSDKTKKVKLENNTFFLNKTADVTVTISPSIKFMKVEDDGFDDLGDVDGMVSVKDNIGLKDPALFKGVIDTKYLEAFLNATYSEKVDYDENSPMNQFRAALGLNKQGKITSKVSMFANPYPFESAIKFFGAVQGVGAQKPLQVRQ